MRSLTFLVIPLLVSCSEPEGVVCASPIIPSVEARIRDEAGNPAATGATVTIRKPGGYSYSAPSSPGSPLSIFVADGRNTFGTFQVTVEKPGHNTVVIENVIAQGSPCGVIAPAVVDVILRAIVTSAP